MGICLRCYSYHEVETNGVTIYIHTDNKINITLRPADGSTLGIFEGGCAAGTLEPLAYTRASSAEFFYPILD